MFARRSVSCPHLLVVHVTLLYYCLLLLLHTMVVDARLHVDLLMQQSSNRQQQRDGKSVSSPYDGNMYKSSSSIRRDRRDHSSSTSQSDLVAHYSRPIPSVSHALNIDADAYEVNNLPGLSTTSKHTAGFTRHWAGLVPVPYADVDSYGSVFFWLFEPSSGPNDTSPLIVWLNGGPGTKVDLTIIII